jgi:anti-sigma B factor antagonist
MGEDTIVEVAGEVDVATVSLLAKALGDAVYSGTGNVILDAQNLIYIDSAGLQTLISTQQKLARSDRRIAIVGCHGIFHKLIKITHLDQRFSIYPTVDDALAALSNAEKR